MTADERTEQDAASEFMQSPEFAAFVLVCFNEGIRLAVTDDRRSVLQAWADGLIRYGEAMARTGIETYEGLLRAAQDCGVVWDCQPAEEEAAAARITEILRPHGERRGAGVAVTLVLPDAGPLMHLAAVDKLDLLQMFGGAVKTADVVIEECMKCLEKPGAERLKAWSDQFDVITSPIIDIYRQGLEEERRNPDCRANQGLGDAAAAWLLANIGSMVRPDEQAIVLVPYTPLGLAITQNVHVLSTKSWLQLEPWLRRVGAT